MTIDQSKSSHIFNFPVIYHVSNEGDYYSCLKKYCLMSLSAVSNQ